MSPGAGNTSGNISGNISGNTSDTGNSVWVVRGVAGLAMLPAKATESASALSSPGGASGPWPGQQLRRVEMELFLVAPAERRDVPAGGHSLEVAPLQSRLLVDSAALGQAAGQYRRESTSGSLLASSCGHQVRSATPRS
jgi:hypothetical protein